MCVVAQFLPDMLKTRTISLTSELVWLAAVAEAAVSQLLPELFNSLMDGCAFPLLLFIKHCYFQTAYSLEIKTKELKRR